MLRFLTLLFLVLLSTSSWAQKSRHELVGVADPDIEDPLEQTFTELAPGVWVGNRPDSTRLPVTPNTTFVISEEGVIVFDGGNLPLVAERVIAKIRQLTELPVTHVIISHWHMDHVLGVSHYQDAFPGVQVIAHPYTRELIFRYLDQQEQDMRNTVPNNVPGIQAMLDPETRSADQPKIDPQTSAWLAQFVADAEFLNQQYQNFSVAYPNLVFTGDMTLYSGSRIIELLHLGSGNTPGDLVMWLPEEKILTSGDIVVWPTPYGHGGRPQEWAQTLKKIAAMDVRILVPGHGDLQTNMQYLALMSATLENVAKQMNLLVTAGLSQEESLARLDLSALESQYTHGDAFLQARFQEWFVEPIATAAWLIASGQDPEIVH